MTACSYYADRFIHQGTKYLQMTFDFLMNRLQVLNNSHSYLDYDKKLNLQSATFGSKITRGLNQ